MQTDYQTGQYGSTATDTGEEIRSKVEETASTVVDQVSQVAETKATTQKERAAETLGSVAQSIRDAGDGLREQQPQIADFVEQAATRVDDVSSYIRDHDVRDLVGEAERLARREPLLFLGGALAVGFIAARFLKASAPQRSSGFTRDSYGSSGSLGYSAYAQPDTGSRPELTSGGSMYGAGGYGAAGDDSGSANGWSANDTSGWTENEGQSDHGSEHQGDDRIGRE